MTCTLLACLRFPIIVAADVTVDDAPGADDDSQLTVSVQMLLEQLRSHHAPAF